MRIDTTVVTVVAVLAGVVLLVIMVLFLLGRLIGRGTRIPLGRGYYFRRWVEPTDPETCSYIVGVMQALCRDSVGCLLPHPALQGNIKELHNKTVFVCYDKSGDPVMFNMMLRPSNPPGMEGCIINHLGLVIVANKAKGKGMQKLTILNAVLQIISLRSLNIYITDIGDSPSAARLVPTYLTDPFPDYTRPEKMPAEHQIRIFNHMLENHRKDMGISANAQPNPDNFVVKYSNEPTGGGSVPLAAFSRERHSRTKCVNSFFYDRVVPEDYDELFLLGTLDLTCLNRVIAGKLIKKKM